MSLNKKLSNEPVELTNIPLSFKMAQEAQHDESTSMVLALYVALAMVGIALALLVYL